MNYPVPDNEKARLSVLRSTGILAQSDKSVFEQICQEVKERFVVPIAIISLVDDSEQRFAASCGLGVDGTPRNVAFCAHAIMSDEILLVRDARLDPRFMNNPLVVGDPFIVFYAGAPLVYGEGIRLGTICIIDTEPRVLDDADRLALVDFAERIVGEIWAVDYAGGVLTCTSA